MNSFSLNTAECSEWTTKNELDAVMPAIFNALGETHDDSPVGFVQNSGRLPTELSFIILEYLERNTYIFGDIEWKKYFNANVPPEPPFPSEFLSLKHTHTFIYIPTTLHEVQLTTTYFISVLRRIGFKCRKYDEYVDSKCGHISMQTPYWIAISNGIIDKTQNKNFEDQIKILKEKSTEWNITPKIDDINEGKVKENQTQVDMSPRNHNPLDHHEWDAPILLEAVVSAFATKVLKEESIFSGNDLTGCKEIFIIYNYKRFRPFVGSCFDDSLVIAKLFHDQAFPEAGLAAVFRKF